MDVWVNFTNATKWQAEGIFKCFFPCKKVAEVEEAPSNTDAGAEEKGNDKTSNVAQKNLPGSKRKAAAHSIPLLLEDELNVLAKRFADQIPDNEMSVRIISIFCYLPLAFAYIKISIEIDIGIWIACVMNRSQACRVTFSRTKPDRVNV